MSPNRNSGGPRKDPSKAGEAPEELDALEEFLEYRFHDRSLLQRALTHGSAAAELEVASNERLEFLGDAVLDLTVGEYLMNKYPEVTEGELSRMRASVVSASALAETAREVGLGRFFSLGRGEDRGGGRDKQSVLANVFEAIFGAVFLDSNYECAREVSLRCLRGSVESVRDRIHDHKTALQEATQRTVRQTPSYRVLGVEGPDHDPTYQVSVSLDGDLLARGEGSSRKSAEQQAAMKALERLAEQE